MIWNTETLSAFWEKLNELRNKDSVFKKADIRDVENSLSQFLPVYMVWTIIVIFIFPFIFSFK